MKITCGDESIETHCTGCMCHEFYMQFGSNKDICQECGCPKTPKGFEEMIIRDKPKARRK